jgi:drug/metabolite transporter (DMT)-like permease
VVFSGRIRELRTRKLHWHMTRATLVLLVMLGMYYALAHIPLVEIEAIGHAAPLFVAILSPLLLKERVTGHNWLAIGLGMLGVLIILRPDPAHFRIAHLVMLACAAAYAILIILVRTLTRTDSIVSISFYVYPPGALLAGLLARGEWVAPTITHWGVFIAFGTCNTLATLLYVLGLRHVDAVLAATLDYVTLIWVTVYGILFWGELPDPITAVGIVFIVLGGIYIVRHSTRRVDESLVQTSDH